MFSVNSARVSKSAGLLNQPADLHPLSLLFLVKWGGMKLTMLLLLIFTAATVTGSRICILVLLIIISIYIFKCRTNKTMLLAEITNGEPCVYIPLKRLSVCPTYWTIKSPSNVLSITIRGKRSPTIEFSGIVLP